MVDALVGVVNLADFWSPAGSRIHQLALSIDSSVDVSVNRVSLLLLQTFNRLHTLLYSYASLPITHLHTS